MNIRKNDTVVVICGEHKGRKGRVLEVYPVKERVLVEGVNMIKKHMRANNRTQQGGIVEREAPIHISNVQPWCETANAPSKIVMKQLEDGTRVRTWKINGESL
jgi:large subunit ribosomal protein L24